MTWNDKIVYSQHTLLHKLSENPLVKTLPWRYFWDVLFNFRTDSFYKFNFDFFVTKERKLKIYFDYYNQPNQDRKKNSFYIVELRKVTRTSHLENLIFSFHYGMRIFYYICTF